MNNYAEMARNNTMKLNQTKLALQNAARNLFGKKDLDKGWRYDLESNSFKKYFNYFEIGSTPLYEKTLIEFEYCGCLLTGHYDHWESKMDYSISIPEDCKAKEVQMLIEQLKARRRAFKAQFCTLCESIANAYFEENKEQLISGAGVYDALRSKNFIVWDCGDTKYPSDEKMRNAFQRKITHNKSECLDSFDEYIPIIFEDDKYLESKWRCGGYELTFYRNYIVDKTLTHYPEIHVTFEMRTSSDTMFKCALDLLFWKNNAKERKALMDFAREVEGADWFMEDNIPTCYVPIIHEEYAEYINNNSSNVCPQLSTEIVVKYIPLFERDTTCIKCTPLIW